MDESPSCLGRVDYTFIHVAGQAMISHLDLLLFETSLNPFLQTVIVLTSLSAFTLITPRNFFTTVSHCARAPNISA